jgi:hypothetical protein
MIASNGQSPFDSIREVDEHGNESWSARTVMPFLGYEQWRRFVETIDQAHGVIAAEQGEILAEAHVAATDKITKNARGQSRSVADYRLSRYACYLTAMRGDSRKPEIRAALIYFASKTREAEIAQAQQFAIPTTFAGALELAARQARELEDVRAENTELVETNARLSPKARVADQYGANPGITPTVFHKTHFPQVSERGFFEHLYRKDYLIDQRNTRWDDLKQEWKDGPEHRHPTAKGKRYFYLAPKLDRQGVRRQQTLVIPGDAEHDLVAALERDGLPSRNRPALPGAHIVQFPTGTAGGAA